MEIDEVSVKDRKITENSENSNISQLQDVLQYQRDAIGSALKSIFPDSQDESRIQLAKRILGEFASNFSDEELEIYNIEFQYLISTWLDMYEISLFEGKTLQEVLKEK
jgi:hypothetical protein